MRNRGFYAGHYPALAWVRCGDGGGVCFWVVQVWVRGYGERRSLAGCVDSGLRRNDGCRGAGMTVVGALGWRVWGLE